MTNKEILEAQRDTMKAQKQEIDIVLTTCRQNVDGWISRTILALQREQDRLLTTGDIADGEYEIPYRMLADNVKTLRETQDLMESANASIEDMERDLEDDALWTKATA